MSKRICLSLLSAPQRSFPALQQCSALRPTTARGNPHSLQCLRQRHQPFSTTPTRRVGTSRMVSGGKRSQPSMSVQMKAQQASAMRDGTMLDHLGLLDNTYVPPSGKNLPSYFSDWSGRWKLQRYRLMSLLDEFKSYFMAWWMVTPRPKLEKRKIPGIAKELYEQMYTAFAAGNLQSIESKLAPGILGSLRNRIAQRSPNTALVWNVQKYYGSPEVMSFKFLVLPEGPNRSKMGITQAVVKIKSKQSLQTVERRRTRELKKNALGSAVVKEVVLDSAGKAVPEEKLAEHREKSAKVLTEFLVIQRLMKKSALGPWHIWGTTEESSVAKMEKSAKEFQAKLAAQQRMKNGQ